MKTSQLYHQNDRYSKASDVWSFGVVLWELLTSQVPYHKLPWGTVLYSVGVNGSSLPVPSNCPPVYNDLLVKCAKREPTDRPGFSRIIAILQDVRLGGCESSSCDSADGSPEWKKLQAHWRTEMEKEFASLKQSEQDVAAQLDELRVLQRRQTLRQMKLNAMEFELVVRSRSLQYVTYTYSHCILEQCR